MADLLLFRFAFKDGPVPPQPPVLNVTDAQKNKTHTHLRHSLNLSDFFFSSFFPDILSYPSFGVEIKKEKELNCVYPEKHSEVKTRSTF